MKNGVENKVTGANSIVCFSLNERKLVNDNLLILIVFP